MRKFLCFLSLCFSIQSLTAQQWATAYQESVDFYNNYQSTEAKRAAERALRSYDNQNEIPEKNRAAILRQLSIVCYDLNQMDQSLEYAKAEVELMQELGLGTAQPFVNALQNLALIRSARLEYGAAEPLLRTALSLALNFYDEPEYLIGALKGNLASALFHLKKDQEAEVLFVDAVQTMNPYDELGPDYYTTIYDFASLKYESGDLETALQYFLILEDYYNYETPNLEYASTLIKTGDLHDRLGQIEQAKSKYQLSIANFVALDQTSNAEYEIAVNNLALTLQKAGQFQEAETLLVELVERREENKTGEPLLYASSLTQYANQLIRKGQLNVAKAKLEEILATYSEFALDKDGTYIAALASLSGLVYTLGNVNQAEVYVEEALGLAYELDQSDQLFSILEKKAKVFAKLGRFSQARELAEASLAKSIEVNGDVSIETCYTKNVLAQILTDLGSYEEAASIYQELIPNFETLLGRNHPECATVAANYSSLLQLKGDYFAAENLLKSAISIKKKAFGETNLDYLTTYENLAILYQNTARYTLAGEILEEIKRTKESFLEPDDPSLAYTYTNLGNVKKQMAQYIEAEAYLKKSRQIYRQTIGEKHVFYASLLNSLALLYQRMGNMESAKPLLEESLATYESLIGKMNPEYATSLENLATLYQMEENFDEAKRLLEEVLSIDEQILGTDHPLYSKTLHNLASIYEKNSEFEKAKALYTEALDIDARVFGQNHPAYATTLYNLAVLEQELENYETASEHYNRVVEIRAEILGTSHPDYTFALYGLATILHKTNKLEEAKTPYFEVIDRYSDDIVKYFPALSEHEKSAFWAKIRPVFESYMDYSVEFIILNKGTREDRDQIVGKLYNLQLSTKALLLNATNKVRRLILSSKDEELVGLFNQWISTKEQIVKAYAMTRKELEISGVNIVDLETQANDMEKQLSLKSSDFSREFNQELISWKDVQRNLSPGQTAIEIIRVKKKVKNDSILYVSLILDETTIVKPKMVINANGVYMEDKGFKNYKNSIIYKVEDLKSYHLFWKDIHEHLSSSTSDIYLSADGVYNKVNVSTLYDDDNKEYVIGKYKLRLLSNTKEVLNTAEGLGTARIALMYGYPKYDLGKRRMKKSGLFNKKDTRYAFGDKVAPLPGTYQEITNIEKELFAGGWTYEKHMTDGATEDRIKQLNNPTVLHIATHGFFLADIQLDEDFGLGSRAAKFNPLLRSGLLLAGAENTINNQEIPGEEDGILTAYEAMNLNLDNTQLVVMSACETGLGEVKNGEGVYGLQRSFLVAGAANLIMSLWKVNDETTQLLMSGFYQNWIKTGDKHEAFNKAIMNVKKEYEEPYYWGAFVILGK